MEPSHATRRSATGRTGPRSLVVRRAERKTPMLFAILELGDFAVITLLIIVFAGGRAAASAYLRPADGHRLKNVEHRLDLILTHLGIDYVPPSKSAWQELADAGQKIS